MIQYSWNDLTSQALESRQFRLAGDPRVEWPVAAGKVDSDLLASIVQYYNYDAEKLPCCLCGRAIHHGGAVVQLKDYSFRLVGQCCGRVHFVGWAREASAFRNAERTASDRLKARKVLASRDQLESECFHLRPIIDRQEALRHQIQLAFGDTFKSIALEVFRSSGRLSYIDDIGDLLSNQGGSSGLRNVQRDTAALGGASIFTMTNKRKKLDAAISKLRLNLDEMRSALNGSLTLRGRLKKHNEAVDEILSVIECYNAGMHCLTSSNAESLNFWFGKKGIQKNIEIVGDGWIVHSADAARPIRQIDFETLQVPTALLEARA